MVGFGDDGVWTAIGNGDGTFQTAGFPLNDLGYNQGWRVDRHPRFALDIDGDGFADVIGFGNAGIWTAIGKGDGHLQIGTRAWQQTLDRTRSASSGSATPASGARSATGRADFPPLISSS